MNANKVTLQKDCSVKKAKASGLSRPGDHAVLTSSGDEHSSGGVQALILKELQRVNSRLEAVEDSMESKTHRRSRRRDSAKLSTPEHLTESCCKTKKCRKSKMSTVFSESSSLSVLRSSKDIQKQVDERIAEIESRSKIEGKDSKLKSKRGWVEVLVSQKVAWPHDNVPGGPQGNGSHTTS